MQFVGRFMLTGLSGTKTAIHPTAEDGSIDQGRYVMRPAVRVEFAAVKDGSPADETFGQATPFGKVEMSIQNPVLARELERIWHDYLHVEDATPAGYAGSYVAHAGQPKFETTFRLIEEE